MTNILNAKIKFSIAGLETLSQAEAKIKDLGSKISSALTVQGITFNTKPIEDTLERIDQRVANIERSVVRLTKISQSRVTDLRGSLTSLTEGFQQVEQALGKTIARTTGIAAIIAAVNVISVTGLPKMVKDTTKLSQILGANFIKNLNTIKDSF